MGGYDDWLRQRPAAQVTPKVAVKGKTPVIRNEPSNLNQKQQKELKFLPEKIEKLENKIAAFHERFAKPDFYQQEEETIAEVQHKLAKVEAELSILYQRWEALEDS